MGTFHTAPANLADRDYFSVHQNHPRGALFIGRPVVGKLTGKWSIHMSIPLVRPDGSFGGVVLGAVNPEHFSRFYDQAELGADGLVALIGQDGVTRISRSGNRHFAGVDMKDSTLFRELARRPVGTFESLGKLEGVRRFYSYRTLEPYPLIVSVATSQAEVLAPFHQREQFYYRLAIALSALTLLFVAGLLAAFLRQRAVLGALAASETRYRAIFENAVEGIFQTTPEGRFLAANPAMARILGYRSADELVARRTDIAVEGYAQPERREAFKRLMERDGRVQRFESEARRKDGSTTWVSETAREVRDADGRLLYYEGILEDIDARKRAEERIALLAQRFAKATDLASVYRALLDFVRETVPCNGIFVSLYDAERQQRHCVYAWSEGIEEDVSELPPLPMTESPHSRATRSGEVVIEDDFQAAVRGMPGVDLGEAVDPRVPQSCIVVPMVVMGRVIGAMEIQSVERAAYKPQHVMALRMAAPLAGMATENVRLLEDERRMRLVAENSMRRKAAIVESALDAIVEVDDSGRIVEFNPAAEGMFGCSRDAALGQEMAELIIPPAWRERHRRGFAAYLLTGEAKFLNRRVELTALRRDGSEFPVELAIAPSPSSPLLFSAFIRDITERKDAHDKLLESQAFLDIVERAAHLGGWEVNLADNRISWSDEACRIRELPLGATMKVDAAIEYYAPECRAAVRAAMIACASEGLAFDEEWRIATPSGRLQWVRVIGRPVRDGDGSVVRLQGVLQDITSSKRAEEAVRLVETRLTSTLEHMTDAFVTLDRDWRVTYMNRVTERIFKCSREELMGKVVWDELLVTRGSAFELQSRRAMEANCTVEYEEFYVPLGIWLEVRSYPSDSGLAIYFRDVTERKRGQQARESLEGQLRESQKMEAIGRLAGGVAHDFNNILGAILGNLELARQEAGSSPQALESFEEIRKAGHRGRDLVGQILAFSRRQPVARRIVDIVGVLEESVRMLRVTLPARVKVGFVAKDRPAVLADPTQIGQVLLNLGTNAAHAMQGLPGTVNVTVESVVVKPGNAHASHPLPPDLKAGRWARISVADDGVGMDAATLARIYEPFFTTKPVGEGTGLGLPVVHGIVASHGGTIAVQSHTGQGTRFDLYFPEVEGKEEAVEIAPEPIADIARGQGQRILYLDDDEAQLFLVERMLEKRGYRVHGFQNQREALAAVQADPGAFDLFVTDYSMPGMSGLDVARAVRAIRADLPVAVATGYVTDELQEQAAEAGVREVIFKPNAVTEFIDVVQQLVPARDPPKM
jgi:two-component system cell cycle sensor histidine kinase/response regulator CckA